MGLALCELWIAEEYEFVAVTAVVVFGLLNCVLLTYVL